MSYFIGVVIALCLAVSFYLLSRHLKKRREQKEQSNDDNKKIE